MGEILQNLAMTVFLLPLSMLLVWIFMKITGPYDRKFYWGVVAASYAVLLFICWGVETGYLYKMVH
ncbi:MAG: hypothetical protein Q8R76_06910 [Candidatus Omnitrophota bacterium]|nr:hypothetical protein [Candidatus Omnitrophota bacterium]